MPKVALITGASRGIGRAIALRLAKDGYIVAMNYCRNERAAVQAAQVLSAFDKEGILCKADVTDEAAVRAMVKAVEDKYGHIDLLVNNAGIAEQALFTELTAAQWKQMMDVHVNGAFYTCSAVLPAMIRRQSGCIVNIASMWGQTGASCEVHYSTAKAALIGMTKALAKEVGPSGIRVNCVAPGAIETDMMAGFSAEDKEAIAEETPLCRLGRAEEIASAVSFLASEDASFITGQVLAANGGLVI
ncbi:MAG: SDR family oxidoreductase [Clostridia bacterium]|nr:SDR family oxidoreductase [Clostridia bacterium]